MWLPPRGYKGLRTGYRYAVRVKIKTEFNNHWQCVAELEDWCEENCRYHWSHVDGCFWFEKTSEAVMFKMIYGGS